MPSQRTNEEFLRSLFRQRMQREEREAELDKRIDKYREEGKSRRQAICAAMRDMGYEGPAKERRKWKEAKSRFLVNKRKQKQKECQDRYHRKMRNKALDEVMAKLKPNAPPEQEMDWVASHPKLLLVQQISAEADDDDELKREMKAAMRLTAGPGADIDPATCPSKSAVSMLYTAMLDPNEWNKKKRDAHKSKTQAGTGAGAENDASDVTDDLSTLERVHKQFLEQQKAAKA